MNRVAPRPNFQHLLSLTNGYGTFEHAQYAVARREHGYCVDDVARVLVVASREREPSASIHRLARGSLDFLSESQSATGECRNRRTADGTWIGVPSVEDCWGRSLWGLGLAIASAHEFLVDDAQRLFDRGVTQRSPWLRATCFAVLGAAAVLTVEPGHAGSLSLLRDAADRVEELVGDEWPWPESRLTYANAVVPDAMLALGVALGRPVIVRQGLGLLAWLLQRETNDGHLSVTPAGGSGPTSPRPGFDQQPIEVASMADACARAIGIDDSPTWPRGIVMAHKWFEGDNDADVVMWDRLTGGGFDGLHRDSANLNQGAESTLAVISTHQQVRLHQLLPA